MSRGPCFGEVSLLLLDIHLGFDLLTGHVGRLRNARPRAPALFHDVGNSFEAFTVLRAGQGRDNVLLPVQDVIDTAELIDDIFDVPH